MDHSLRITNNMKTFEVLLTRSYIIKIDAKDETEALRNVEFFIGGEKDLSNEKERANRAFRINNIEMTVNEAVESYERSESPGR